MRMPHRESERVVGQHRVDPVRQGPEHVLDLVKAFALLRSPALPENLADHTALYYALHCWNDYAQHFAEEN